MTLDEAITHCEEVAEKNEKQAKIYDGQAEALAYYSCKECANEHRQLAKWLKELKAYRRYSVLPCYLMESKISEEVNADDSSRTN